MAVRRLPSFYFDLRLISSTSSAARASFHPVVARITLIRGLTIRVVLGSAHLSCRLISIFVVALHSHITLRGRHALPPADCDNDRHFQRELNFPRILVL